MATATSMVKMGLRVIMRVSYVIRYSTWIGELSENARSPIFKKIVVRKKDFANYVGSILASKV